ncbi:MAG: hypothetical protein ACI835_002725 [Planctomycetota bacterium]
MLASEAFWKSTISFRNSSLPTRGRRFDVTGIPNEPGILFAGTHRMDLPFGCGVRYVSGMIKRGNLVLPTENQHTDTGYDMSLPNTITVPYFDYDSANLGACGNGWNLTNALRPKAAALLQLASGFGSLLIEA